MFVFFEKEKGIFLTNPQILLLCTSVVICDSVCANHFSHSFVISFHLQLYEGRRYVLFILIAQPCAWLHLAYIKDWLRGG